MDSQEGPPVDGPPPTPGKYLKVSLFLRKKPDVSDEYFHAYWRNNHLKPAFANETFAGKVRRYNQHHITPELRNQAKKLGIPVLDYDGVAEVWLDSVEDWSEIVSDKDFQDAVAKDELHFILHPINIMFGWDNLIVDKETGVYNGPS
ncbi:Dimeric alpha-beta barrel [Niveomyces insectorum RCEF 264]|uniref:Dimeric alpha-beta barrel n=1 Tax=Niveomyces insectorum RCEF 264 TaxID=1081102 RepID=A0A167Q8L4_9HYPO|nr:Dimeric alpha-beta barrel [Niveomyces insectorum RCEF 264]